MMATAYGTNFDNLSRIQCSTSMPTHAHARQAACAVIVVVFGLSRGLQQPLFQRHAFATRAASRSALAPLNRRRSRSNIYTLTRLGPPAERSNRNSFLRMP